MSAGRNPGPFHWATRLVHCISRLYEATHLDLILKCIGKEYRDSEGKMAWFKYPTDPNQAFAEIQEQQMAFYVEMAKGYTRSNVDDDNNTSEKIWDYMIERAKKYPAVMVFMNHLLMNEILLMVLDSERRGQSDGGDFDQYEAAQHLSALVFATTNSFKYVQMCMAERVRWGNASEAQRKFHAAYAWLGRTKHGTNMHRDRWMETNVMYVRSVLGKLYYKGKEKEIDRVCRTLPALMEVKHGVTRARGKTGYAPSRPRQFSQVSKAALVFARKTNFAGPAPPTTFKGIALEEGSMLAFSGKEINPAVLSVFDIGEARVKKCWQEAVSGSAYVDQNTDFKSKGSRTWSTVYATKMNADAREQFENKRRTTVFWQEIHTHKDPVTKEKLFPKKSDIEHELMVLQVTGMSAEAKAIPSAVTSITRSQLSKMLATARRAEFALQQPEPWVSPEQTTYNPSSVAAHQVYNLKDPRLPHLRHQPRASDIIVQQRVRMDHAALDAANDEAPASFRHSAFLRARGNASRIMLGARK